MKGILLMDINKSLNYVVRENKRFETLDWFRGGMAVSIVLYHYISWYIKLIDSGSVIGRLGIYAVSSFYILSGLSLAIVYNNKMKSIKNIKSFIIRRILRIFPLLWFATVTYIIIHRIPQYHIAFPTTKDLFLNFTGLYGFVNPRGYILVGGWSIGNELVFYLIFPLIIYMYDRSVSLGNVLLVISVMIEIVFSFHILTPNDTISNQWSIYINPFNQLFLFILGIAIYYNFNKLENRKLINVLGIVSILVFVFYPVSGNQINIVTGYNRFIFSILCCIIILMFWKIKRFPSKVFRNLFSTIGVSTYSIYLLHHNVVLIVKLFMDRVGFSQVYMLIVISIIVTIGFSFCVYRYLEKPFIKLGKRIS